MKKSTNIQIVLPGSKSVAARALVCRLLSGHDTKMENLPDCGDTRGMLRLTEAARRGVNERIPVSVEIGEGGTTLRFGLAACASIPGLDIRIKAEQRLLRRPHDTLVNLLRERGAEIDKTPYGFHIKGRNLRGGRIDVDGSVSSQYISALMLSAPVWDKDTELHIKAPVVSYPYIEMTAGVMRDFGAFAETETLSSGDVMVRVKATGYPLCAAYSVEGDWSGASYFYETLLIRKALGLETPKLEIPSLKAPVESLQGDSRVADIYRKALSRLDSGEPLELDLADEPDLVPALAVGCCVAGIRFRFMGIAHLRHKETDRMAALATELGKLGYVISTGADFMSWDGKIEHPDSQATICTYNDHRMAMAFAPARLRFPDISIENPAVVEKSFPEYWTEIGKILKI